MKFTLPLVVLASAVAAAPAEGETFYTMQKTFKDGVETTKYIPYTEHTSPQPRATNDNTCRQEKWPLTYAFINCRSYAKAGKDAAMNGSDTLIQHHFGKASPEIRAELASKFDLILKECGSITEGYYAMSCADGDYCTDQPHVYSTTATSVRSFGVYCPLFWATTAFQFSGDPCHGERKLDQGITFMGHVGLVPPPNGAGLKTVPKTALEDMSAFQAYAFEAYNKCA